MFFDLYKKIFGKTFQVNFVENRIWFNKRRIKLIEKLRILWKKRFCAITLVSAHKFRKTWKNMVDESIQEKKDANPLSAGRLTKVTSRRCVIQADNCSATRTLWVNVNWRKVLKTLTTEQHIFLLLNFLDRNKQLLLLLSMSIFVLVGTLVVTEKFDKNSDSMFLNVTGITLHTMIYWLQKPYL